MTPSPILALIASRPGDMQDSLVALMTTMPQVSAVLIAEDAPTALRTMARHRPALVVIETQLEAQESCVPLREIKAGWASTACVALAADVEQQRQARSAGADVVLIGGFPPSALIAAIEELLSPPGDSPRAGKGG